MPLSVIEGERVRIESIVAADRERGRGVQSAAEQDHGTFHSGRDGFPSRPTILCERVISEEVGRFGKTSLPGWIRMFRAHRECDPAAGREFRGHDGFTR